VLLVEVLSSPPRVVESLVQLIGRRRREVLLTTEKLGRPILSGVTVDVGRLILEVDDEPQLDARIRHHDLDSVRTGELDGVCNVGMLINIEHAPNGGIAPAPAPVGLALGLALRCHCTLDESEGRPTTGIDGDKYVVSKKATQRQEVAVLRLRTLHQDENLGPRGILPSPLRPTGSSPRTHRPPEEVMRSAAAANCCAERIGVAPYRPARYRLPIDSCLRGSRSTSG